MTQIEQMLSGPWAVRLGWTLMHSLWEIAAVAAIVAALLALLRRRSAEVRYLAACVGLAAMLVPPAVTYSLIPTPPDAVVGTQPDPVKPATGTLATEAAPGPGGSSRSPAVKLPGPGLVFMAAETSDAAPADTPPAASPGLPLPEAASGTASRWVPWLAACWILGVLLLSVRNLGGWFAAWRLKRFGTMPIPEAWLRRFSELKTRLGVGLPVRLVQSVLVEVPVVVGWLRPVILMPVGILTGFSPHEIEAMLAHELSHIRRYDCLVNLFQTVAETLLFYHPAAWWLSRRIRIEREHCCDDAAVRVCGSRPLYARALVSLAARSAVPHPALSARGGSLVGRVRRILGLPDQGGCPAAWLAGAAVLVGLTIVGASLLAPAEAGESSEPAETAASADADAAPAETREAGLGLQLRLTATADKEYKRRYTLPLLLELKNTSKRRLSPALRMTSRLKAETTDGEGKPLRVADLIELTPWEQRDTANTLPPGATIRWTTAFDRLAFIDRPAAGSKVRLRFQLEDRSLPGRVDSNWVELTMRDAPPLVSGQGDFPGVWAQFVDFVYREPTGAGYHALHVDGEGHAELIAYSAGEDPWYGRHSATMSRKHLDFLADVLKRQQAWKLVGLKPKAARPEDPHVEFAYVAAGSLLRCRFPMEQVKEEPALLAIHRAAEFLMACVVQDARAAERDWGPLSGDEDDGLQCRLRATKEVWQPGETPAFEADVRNVGMRDLLAFRSEVVFDVEVDGKRYRYTAPSSAKSSPLPPGREYHGIAITLGSHWREKSTLQPIPWAPGKHTVRVAFVAWAGGEEPSARAQSNPVTITIAGEQPKAAEAPGTLKLEAEVLGLDGQPVRTAEIVFWKATESPAEKEPPEPPRTRVTDFDWVWHDRATGKTWTSIHFATPAPGRATKDELSPGEYRVTAIADRDHPLLGVSDVIRLDGSRPLTTVKVRLQDGPSLRVETVDAASGQPVDAALRLVRPDGLPVLSRSRWMGARDGHFTYPGLAPGEYRLYAGRMAVYYGDPHYTAETFPVKLAIEAGQSQRVVVRLNPIPQDEQEAAKRWPWVVTGKVTDQSGNGLPGVTVRVHSGMGSLKMAGRVTTANDGTYTVRFGPGVAVLREPGKQWGAGVQAAIVSPSKPGYYEWNLHRQGDLRMAGEMPDEKGLEQWNARPERIVLPNKPYRVDFVLLPAAAVDVQLVDPKDVPVVDKGLHMKGHSLPPASSAMAAGSTDKDGKYQFGEVPLRHAWWFSTGYPDNRRGELRSPSVVFSKPGQYRVKLRMAFQPDGEGRLEIVSITDAKGQDARGKTVLVDPARAFISAITDPGVNPSERAKTPYGYSERVRKLLSFTSNSVTFDKEGNVVSMCLCEPWIDGDVVREFPRLPKLERLYLRGPAEIGDEGLAALGRIAGLTRLLVSSGKVTDKGLAHLANLKKLESLSLWSNAITDEGLRTLSRIQGLKDLGLYGGTRITEAGLRHLAGMKQLKSLRIDNATLAPAAVERLKQALPDCKLDVTRPDSPTRAD